MSDCLTASTLRIRCWHFLAVHSSGTCHHSWEWTVCGILKDRVRPVMRRVTSCDRAISEGQPLELLDACSIIPALTRSLRALQSFVLQVNDSLGSWVSFFTAWMASRAAPRLRCVWVAIKILRLGHQHGSGWATNAHAMVITLWHISTTAASLMN